MQPKDNQPTQRSASHFYPSQSGSGPSQQPSSQAAMSKEASGHGSYSNIDPLLANYNINGGGRGQSGASGTSTSGAVHAGYAGNWSTSMPLGGNFHSYPNYSATTFGASGIHSATGRQDDRAEAMETASGPQDGLGESDQESNGEGSGLEDTDGGDDMDEDEAERAGARDRADGTEGTSRSGTVVGKTDETTENRRKRQSLRRGTACVRCRKKKLKCSGERPVCAGCANSKKPTECVYEERPKKIPKIRRRQTRLQQIEAQIEERSQLLAVLETVQATAGGPFVPRSTGIPSTSLPNENTSQQDLPLQGQSGLPLHANSNPPTAMNMLSSDNMSFPMPALPQAGSSTLAYAYPNVLDMGQYPVPDSSQSFYGSTHGDSFLQSTGVSDMATSMTRFATPMAQSTTDAGNQSHGSLSSFLAEIAASRAKRNSGGNAFEPQIPAHIMNKYSDDIFQAVEMTTLLASRGLTIKDGQVNVSINSPMEYALIYLVLPYTQHLCIPLHPNRFLDSLALPAETRPHPALLYIMFAEASRVISKGLPLPFGARVVPDFYNQPDVTLFQYAMDLQQAFCDRSQALFHQALKQIDRPLDLLKASSGICRFLASMGRSVEAWHSVCFRLAVACGVHKIPRATLRPSSASAAPTSANERESSSSNFGTLSSHSPMSQRQPPFGSPWLPPTNNRFESYAQTSMSQPGYSLPKLVVVPPPADNIQLWERIELFWAVKELDWGLSTNLGWTPAISDSEVQTPWPRGLSDYENGLMADITDGSVRDLLYPNESAISSRPQTTRMLALKSLCLMSSAARLSDVVPTAASNPTPQRQNLQPGYIRMPPASTSKALDEFKRALDVFKSRDMPAAHTVPFEWAHDQWWICCRANLATAEVYFFNEYSVYKPIMHENAVASARRVVDLVKSLTDLDWSNLHIWVTMNITVIANTLHREAQRLRQSDQPDILRAAMLAEQDVQYMQRTLNVDIGKWQDIAKMEAIAHRRVRDGLPDRVGMYERMS
ncbi:hypothetical protein QFC21_004087 [Naganishia friedmannii]|uniref:Uncharacterized protein n=1 Tax=Naganishia friedmannii TaxID=89922 RepID=A0ACC2VJV8_9TREE|nr:hypothetical protein QFC21_004087 [Naganishia friedmannii]